jgi:putative peptide zinc metalloprotease protein
MEGELGNRDVLVERDDEEDGITYHEVEEGGNGGRNNVVRLVNRRDDRLRVRGNVQLNRIRREDADPGNLGMAISSCTDCQTFVVALQLNLISQDARVIAPENAAIALNVECTRCYTVARAIQYTFQVDDPTDVPQDVRRLINDMDRELRRIHSDRDTTVVDAESRINVVIAQFADVAERFDDQRDEKHGDNGSPAPTASPTVPGLTPSSTVEPTRTATALSSPTNAPVSPSATLSSTLELPSACDFYGGDAECHTRAFYFGDDNANSVARFGVSDGRPQNGAG